MSNTIADGWTDERIYRQLDAVAFGIWHDDRWIDVVPHGEATSLAIEMFNDLNATIARLTTPPEPMGIWTEQKIRNVLGDGDKVEMERAVELCLRIIGHYDFYHGQNVRYVESLTQERDSLRAQLEAQGQWEDVQGTIKCACGDDSCNKHVRIEHDSDDMSLLWFRGDDGREQLMYLPQGHWQLQRRTASEGEGQL